MNKSQKLSFFETITMATGFTIGSGIITLTGIGIGLTGRSVFLAFGICAILFLVSFRPLFIMSSVIPRMSASYIYSKELISEEAGGLYVYVYFLGRITIAIFGISIAQYLAGMVPFLNTPLLQRLVSCSILTLFFVINLFGIKAAAKIQNFMFMILLLSLILFIVFGLAKVERGFFRQPDFFAGGFLGFYSAVALLFFAVGGAYIITDFATKIERPEKSMVKVIYIVTIGVGILYMLIGIVASGVVPVKDAAFQSLTVTARVIFPHSALFYVFIIGGALGALITTLNSSFVWYSSSLIQACKEGWLPKVWAKTNRYDVPYRLMTIFYIFGLVPALAGFDLTVLSKIAVGMTILSILIPMAGVLKLSKKYPAEWEASKYANKYSQGRLLRMVVLTYVIMATQVYALFAGNPPASNIGIVLYIAIVAVCLYVQYRKKQARKHKSSAK